MVVSIPQAMFCCFQDMHTRGKVPIIVGGTSFYIKTFLEGRGGETPPSTSDGQSRVDDVIKGKNWEER